MVDQITFFEIPSEFPSKIWDDVEETLNPQPPEFYFETMDIITECLFDSERLFKPIYIGAVNEPRPTVYILTRRLIVPPYLTAMYMPPFDTIPARSRIVVHPDDGQTIDSYVNRFAKKLKKSTEYEIQLKKRGNKKQLVITGPTGYNWLDDSSVETETELKPYDASSDDTIGKTDFDLKPYDPNDDLGGESLLG